MRPNRLKLIKANQLKENPDFYKAAEVVVADTGSGIGANIFEQLQAAMQTDIARVKTAKVIADKVQLKEVLLPSYVPFVNDYIEQGHDYPCDVAVQSMIWLFDVGDIAQALPMALYLHATGMQQMPPRFDRDLITFVGDAVYDWASAQLKAEHSASPYLDDFIAYVESNNIDVHPIVLGKNLAMLAKHEFRDQAYAVCVDLCERAEAVNPEGAGVKTMKKNATAKLESLQAK